MKPISRRAAIAALPIAAAGASLPPTIPAIAGLPPGSDDEALIALGRELAACDAEKDRIHALPDDYDSDDEMSDSNDEAQDVIDAIMEMRPKTAAGLAVMAQAIFYEIKWWHTNREGEFEAFEAGDSLRFHLASAVLEFLGQEPEKPARFAEPRTYEEPTEPQSKVPKTEEEWRQWSARRILAFLPENQSEARAMLQIVSEAVESQDFPALVTSAITSIFT
jgi:hypothetical protein